MLRDARLQGVLTANVPGYVAAFAQRLFMGFLPQLQHGIRNRGPFASLVAIEDYQRRMAGAGSPHSPLAYREGMTDPRFTVPPRDTGVAAP